MLVFEPIKDAAQLAAHHETQLQRLLAHFHLSKAEKQYTIPKGLASKEAITLKTSGTQSLVSREYRYPRNNFIATATYVSRLIEQEFGLTRAGKVLICNYRAAVDPAHNFIIHRARSSTATYGLKNSLYHFAYNRDFNTKNLQEVWQEIIRLRFKIVVISPSQLDQWQYLANSTVKIHALAIITGETLYPHTEAFAKSIFTRVTNKMRCWDGGLTFYPCRAGTKHVLDELCGVECDPVTQQLFVTDYFNTVTPFIRYCNGDRGLIEVQQCVCGRFGTVFTEFYGKELTSLRLRNKIIEGQAIVGEIMAIVAGDWRPRHLPVPLQGAVLRKKDFLFNVMQKVDDKVVVTVQTAEPFTPRESHYLKNIVSFVLFRDLSKQTKTAIELVFDSAVHETYARGANRKFLVVQRERSLFT